MHAKTTTQTEPLGLSAALGRADESAAEAGTDPALNALRAENDELRSRLRLWDARDAVTAELRASGARSPELLWDALSGQIEFDGEGKAVNAAAAVAAFKAKYPEQFGTHIPQSIDAGAGVNVGTRLTKAALARMKPSEIAELDWNDVKRVLADR